MTGGTPSSPIKKKRGRKPGAQVPCNDCIARASSRQPGSNELCDRCKTILNRLSPRAAISTASPLIPDESTTSFQHAILDTFFTLQSSDVLLPPTESNAEQLQPTYTIERCLSGLRKYFTSPFWAHLLLQLAGERPAIKHALVAIANLQQMVDMRGHTDVTNAIELACAQCTASIDRIGSDDPAATPDIFIDAASLILSACVEDVRGGQHLASACADKAYTMLLQSIVDSADVARDQSAMHEVQANAIRRLLRPGLVIESEFLQISVSGLDLQDLAHLDTLTKARQHMSMIWTRLTVLFTEVDLDDHLYSQLLHGESPRLYLTAWVDLWSTAFTQLVARLNGNITDEEQAEIATLQAHCLMASVLVHADLKLEGYGWDAGFPQMSAVVDLAEKVITSQSNRSSDQSCLAVSNGTSPCVIFPLNVLDPLNEVCCRCRDDGLRTRALTLLRQAADTRFTRNAHSAWKVNKFLTGRESSLSKSPSPQASSPRSGRQGSDSSISPRGDRSSGSGNNPTSRGMRPRLALNPGLWAALRQQGVSPR